MEAKIISIDKSNKISLSIKALKIAEREKAIKEHGSSDNVMNIGDIIAGALVKK